MNREPLCILVNDLHIDEDCIPEFKKNWDELLQICKEREIYEIVIGGDLWTSRVGQSIENLFTIQECILKATNEYGLTLTIAEGNHDKRDQEKRYGYSHLFKSYEGVTVVDIYSVMDWEDCADALAVMSYFPETGSFREHLDELKKHLDEINIPLSDVTLYIHEGIQGGLPGGFISPTDLPTDIFEDFKQVLVGHYHNRIHVKDTNIYYIGSSRQANFGEDEDKGYTIFYDDGTTEFVQNQVNTRYINYELTPDELNSFKSDKLSDERYKVKLKLKCDETEAKSIDKEALLSQGFNKVETVIKKQKRTVEMSDINEKFDKHTITKEYVKFCDKENIDSELGTEYLSKIS